MPAPIVTCSPTTEYAPTSIICEHRFRMDHRGRMDLHSPLWRIALYLVPTACTNAGIPCRPDWVGGTPAFSPAAFSSITVTSLDQFGVDKALPAFFRMERVSGHPPQSQNIAGHDGFRNFAASIPVKHRPPDGPLGRAI